MLVDGVCSTYAHTFEKRICEDLEIKHMSVDGIGTTGHSWSLIYLPEEKRWAHFDMTMVKFYQDGWIKEHEPYTEQDWVVATTEEIFKMQPTREIHSIDGKKCYYDENNYSEFDSTVLSSKNGQGTDTVANGIRDKSLLQQKEEELFSLEKEQQTITETENLISVKQNEGKDINEEDRE